MRMLKTTPVAAFVALLTLTATVSAATLEVLGGNVSVARGGQPAVRVSGTTQVNVGDVVTTTPGARARIVYSNGCVTVVEPGVASTVTFDDHCVLGLGNSNALVIGAAVAVVGGGAALMLSGDDDKKPASP